ncbi:hypothetical protein ACP4OV_017453 [Aristida adscensionis]
MAMEAADTMTDTHPQVPSRHTGSRRRGGPRYVVPSVVAVGPYHHGLPHLQDMEEVKYAAAHSFCEAAGPGAIAKVYDAMLSVAGDARRCYAPGSAAVARLSDAELAAMMLLDGCFLLQFMANSDAPLFRSSGTAILRDMMLLENQLPWLVLEALMASASVEVDVHGFVARMAEKLFPKKTAPLRMRCCGRGSASERNAEDELSSSMYHYYKPAHLIDLLRFSQIHSMPRRSEFPYSPVMSSPQSSRAVELKQIGIKLAPSTAAWFWDMKLRRNALDGVLSLSPLFLSDTTACILVNLAALEASTDMSWDRDGLLVSSYLSVLAMLIHRKEDMLELRDRGVLCSRFSETQTLAFFKGLDRRLPVGQRYVLVLEEIETYKRHRPLRAGVRRFVVRNYKILGAILSVIGVLVGIFKGPFGSSGLNFIRRETRYLEVLNNV